MLLWARSQAFDHNFILTIVKSWSSSETRYGSIYIGCEKYGSTRSRRKKIDGVEVPVIPRDGSSKKDNCPFLLYGWEVEENAWQLRVESGIHNHDLPPSLQGHQLAGRLTPEEMKLVEDMTVAGVKPVPLLEVLKQTFKKNLSSRQQIYNARSRIKMKKMKQMTPMQHLLNMLTARKFTYSYRIAPDGSLQDLAFAHGYSLFLWKIFPYVMIMDSTYKTNR